MTMTVTAAAGMGERRAMTSSYINWRIKITQGKG